MHVTEQELRDEIGTLKDFVDDIGKIASNIKAGAMSSPSLLYLERIGLEKLVLDIYERIEKFDDLQKDVADFVIKPMCGGNDNFTAGE